MDLQDCITYLFIKDWFKYLSSIRPYMHVLYYLFITIIHVVFQASKEMTLCVCIHACMYDDDDDRTAHLKTSKIFLAFTHHVSAFKQLEAK